MRTTTISALSALLFAGAQAVPMAGHHHQAPAHAHMHNRNKRDIVWETNWEIETVVVIKTLYEDGTEATELASTSTVVATTSAQTTSSVAPAPVSPKETGNAPPAYTSPTTTSQTTSQAPAPTTLSTTSSYVAPPAPAPTTTSTTEAPAPTSYVEPTPAPTTTQAPAPAPEPTTYAPAPSPSQPSGGSSGGATYSGDATHWEPAMGACGWTNTEAEMVIAISQVLFDPKTPGGNPNNNPLCGQMVNIQTTTGGSVQAKVVDRCVGCKEGDLDMTLPLFNKVTNNGDGRVGGIQWSWA